MRTRFYLTAVLTCVLLVTSACSSIQGARHEYLMGGQVVEVTGSDAVVCIGSQNGAQVGQEFTAYKLVSVNSGGSSKHPLRWERVYVGSVRIEQVLDEHFAKARVINGNVAVNNVVELRRK
jgi:hypothetical protein